MPITQTHGKCGPRLRKIIKVAANIKTPSLTVYLDASVASNREWAKTIQTELAHTTLRTVTAKTEILYDPILDTTVIEEDKDFVDAFFAIPDNGVTANLHRQSPRLRLDRAKMLDRKLEMSYVASRIADEFSTDLFVIWGEDNSDKLIIWCHSLTPKNAKDDEEEIQSEEDQFLRQIENTMLNNITLCGIEGVFMIERSKSTLTNAGVFAGKRRLRT